MARSGRFGRAPRSAPSLTNTIVAIAREFQQQRDTNIMDAWQKGGMFEGKKATDSLVLAHWKERVNGVSKDDPLHDTYTNAVTQLDYTIHESKMTAQFALSKKTPADDAKMVNFYLGWAKKVPKDSEFYRTLQRDAGQYIRTRTNDNKAALARAKEEAYQKAQASTDKQYGAAASFLSDTMRRLNQSGYAPGHLDPTLDAPGSGGRDDIMNFNPTDVDEAMRLLGIIAPLGDRGAVEGRTADANPNVLYHSDTVDPKTGKPKPITGKDIVAQLSKFDPHYKPGMPIDTAYLTGLLNRQDVGLQIQIDRANKTGHQTDAAQLTKQKGYVAALSRTVSAMPVEKLILDAEDTFENTSHDPTASPMAVEKARAVKDATLAALMKDPRIAANDNMLSRIQDEIDGGTGPTLKDSFTGNTSGQTSDHALAMKGQREQNERDIETVQRDSVKHPDDPTKNVWTYGTTNASTHQFVPDPNGREIGVAPVSVVNSSGAMPKTMTVDDPRGGAQISIMVTAVPVFGVAHNPVDGKDIPAQNNQPIAWAYSVPNGGENKVHYAYLVKDPSDPKKSVMHYSEEDSPPWAEGLKATPVGGGGGAAAHYEVDFSSYLPTAASATGAPGSVGLGVDLTKPGAVAVNGPDGKPVKGFNVQGVGNATPTNLHPQGTLTWDPYTVARNSDTGRNALGGTDPATDYTSLTLANLMSTADGRNLVNNLDQHPALKAQLDTDAAVYAGMQVDPKTGGFIPGTGDAAKLSQAQTQRDYAVNSKSIDAFVSALGSAWQRASTGSPYPGHDTPNGTPNYTANPIGTTVTKLATDLVKGTPFEPIAQAFMGGTLTKKPLDLEDGKRDFLIKVGNSIKTPGYDAKTITQSTSTSTGLPGSTTSYQNPQPTQPQQKPPTTTSQPNGHPGPRAL